MEKNEIAEVLRKLNTVYGDNKFPVNANVAEVWSECLKDCNYELIKLAVKSHIMESTFPPVIADIFTRYKEEVRKKRERIFRFEEIYRSCLAYYPGAEDSEKSKNLFSIIVAGDLDRACMVKHDVMDYVHEKEIESINGGNGYLPPFEQFVFEKYGARYEK